MDADGSGFTFPGNDFSRGQDSSDPMSWGDIFLDSIDADDPAPPDSNESGLNDGVLGPSTPQQILQQQSSQPSGIGQPLQIQLAQQNVNQRQLVSDTGTNIPTHLQATLPNNGVPQSNTSSVGGSVAYLTPSASSQQQSITSGGNIQNVLATNQPSAAVTVSQGGTKLVQLGPSFPVAALPNSVPLQTILQPGHQITGQTIYGGQNPSLFPAQGSVHIENPKVVNVNFGPHVIQPDGSNQQTIIQTAEGKRVVITNSQLQHLPQSISLTQPIVGTQLIHPAGSSVNNVIRTTVAQATPTLVPSSTSSTRQILLPTGQTVIPRQNGNPQAGFPKNVLLRPLNSGVQPVIYQSGQGNVTGQLIQSQPTLIASSGTGLQVVNTGANQGNQVQLIAQPSLNQATVGQQQLNQNALMNLIGNQSVLPNTGNQLPGIVQGQNILVNGQMLNLSQVGGLTVPLQVQGNNTHGAVTVAGINSGNRQFGTSNTQQMIIQQPNGQQQIMIQPKNTPSPSIIHPNAGGNQRASGQAKVAHTPTPSVNSASSTPAPTPTPSTPTPTPTPDLNLSDFGSSGSKSSQNINILEEALKLSSIDLRPYEDEDFSFFDDPVSDSMSSITPPPAPVMSYPKAKPQPAPKLKAKSSKPKTKQTQPTVNVTVNNNLLGQTTQAQNLQAQKTSISPQKIITASGQVYFISANGQQLVLQQTPTTSKVVTPVTKTSVDQPAISIPSTFVTASTRSSINIPVGNQRTVKSTTEQTSNRVEPVFTLGQVKVESQPGLESVSKPLTSSAQTDNQLFFKSVGTLKAQTVTTSSELIPEVSTSVSGNQKQVVQIKNRQISTLAGTIIKQEPIVKQEPETDTKPAFSFFDSQSQQCSTVFPTTSVVSVNAPHVSVSGNSLSANLTQHNTIMNTASVQSSCGIQNQTNVASHTTLVKTTPSVQNVSSSQSPSVTTSSSHSTSSSKNLKGKDSSANVKSLTQITEKERLENQISDMSMEKQKQLLTHQQKIICRSQDLQKKQQEQQQRFQQQRLLLQKQKEFHQSVSTSKSVSTVPSANTSMCNTTTTDIRSKLGSISKTSLPTSSALPTTVQELMEKTEKNQVFVGNDNSATQLSAPQQEEKFISSSHEAHTQQKLVSQQTQASILHTARCLRAEQQLHRDCTLAVAPDTHLPFKNLSDAMRRLVRYHTMQDHKPMEGSEELRRWDAKYSEVCERLMKKKRCFQRRFSKLILFKDMCPAQWPDNIQNLISFNESLRECLDGEKEEAFNHPDTFQPLQPELLMRSANLETESEDGGEERDDEDSDPSADDNEVDVQQSPHNSLSFLSDSDNRGYVDLMIKHEIKTEPIALSPPPSKHRTSLKRKHEEKPSSGTLKIVLKRKTTSDNFVVKSSSHATNTDKVSGDYKPVVDMEICDSVYEFDSKTSVNKDNPVLVRRRDSLISQTSGQSLSEQEGTSYVSSHSSHIREEDELDDDAEPEEEEEEDYGPSSSGNENEESADEEVEEFHREQNVPSENPQEMQQSRNEYYSSFSEDISVEQTNRADRMHLDSRQRKRELDAFAEPSQWTTELAVSPQEGISTINITNAHAKYSDISTSVSGAGSSRTSKRSFSPSDMSFRQHAMSVTSDDVFISNPGFPPDEVMDDTHSKKEPAPSLHDLIHKGDESFIPAAETKFPEFSTSSIHSSIHSSRSATPLRELVAMSPSSQLETAAASSQLLPSTVLFTTPNKNLLQTDYVMFNESEDEDDDKDSASSSFKIDNKDPQSSMINDSVRTAINSVINNDDDDDDLNEGSQPGWVSSSRRSSFFHPSISSSVSPTHDTTLEAAVENILQS